MADTQDDIAPGTRIGNYEVVSRLGRGGMGAVYLARQIYLRSEAAIKVLLPRYCKKQEIIERFFNEARAATAIRHPGIVQVFDFGYVQERYAYIVMELLHGESLGAHIRRMGRVPVEQALVITRQIASALAAAHDMGIIHRDLKPENIFLVPDPEVPGGQRIRILDFGIAKLVRNPSSATRTRTGIVMGTPAYMAPEQCTGAGHIDARTDLYALGCILFRMLCGQLPFVRDGAGAVMAAHIYEPPPRPGSLAHVPADVEALILRLLAKAPEDRCQDAASVMAAIDIASGSPSSTCSTLPRPAAAFHVEEASHAVSPSPAAPAFETSRGTTLARGASEMAGTVPARAAKIGRYVALGAGILLAGSAGSLWLLDEEEARPREIETAGAMSSALTSGPVAPTASSSPTSVSMSSAPAIHAFEEAGPAGTPSRVVRVQIDSSPPQAVVYRESGGTPLGKTPFREDLPASGETRVYVLKLDNYSEQKVRVAGDRGDRYHVELSPLQGQRGERKYRPATRPRARRDTDTKLIREKRLRDVARSQPLDPFNP